VEVQVECNTQRCLFKLSTFLNKIIKLVQHLEERAKLAHFWTQPTVSLDLVSIIFVLAATGY